MLLKILQPFHSTEVSAPHVSRAPARPRCGQGASSIGITWNFVRNAESQAPGPLNLTLQFRMLPTWCKCTFRSEEPSWRGAPKPDPRGWPWSPRIRGKPGEGLSVFHVQLLIGCLFQGYFNQVLGTHDTCGVHYTFGLPGLLGGITYILLIIYEVNWTTKSIR